jgi:DNA-binding HxlR family transcriptional regulator
MERKLQTSSPHSVLMEHCLSRQVLDLIADKWTALIFALLEKQPTRFNELERAIEGISHKMLTQTLRNLEHRGIVTRKITPTIPPAVEYSLTPLGSTLIPLMATLRQWAEEHMEEVGQACQAYETKDENSSFLR